MFLSNCSKDMYRNTANTPALFTQQLLNSFKNKYTKQLETLIINRSELVETLTKSNHQTAQKYSLELIKLASNQSDFSNLQNNINERFFQIKKHQSIDWQSIKLLRSNYLLNASKLEMTGSIIIADYQKHTDTIFFDAVKLENKWYLTNIK